MTALVRFTCFFRSLETIPLLKWPPTRYRACCSSNKVKFHNFQKCNITAVDCRNKHIFKRTFCSTVIGFKKYDKNQEDIKKIKSHYEKIRAKLKNNESNHMKPEIIGGIKFVNYENIYAYDILTNMKEYDPSLSKIMKTSKSKVQLPENLTQLLFDPLYSAKNVQDLSVLNKQILTMNATDIIAFQNHLKKLLTNKTETELTNLLSTKVVTNLSSVAYKALQNCSLSQSMLEMLAISNLWFELNLTKEGQFLSMLINKLLSYPELDKTAFMHLMFILNLRRTVDENTQAMLPSIVSTILKNNKSTTFEELSIVALAFFKTKTKMPYPLLSHFLRLCTQKILGSPTQEIASYGVVAVLKSIRFSLDSCLFDARTLRNDIRVLIEAIRTHGNATLLDANIVCTHLILLLNFAFLHNEKRFYKIIFDRMMSNLAGFRIKDIERILFCLSNVSFNCPNSKFGKLEDYLATSGESQIFPYHLYHIIYYLMILNYFPLKLIRICSDKTFLASAIELFKKDLTNSLLVTETILHIEMQNLHILDPQQIDKFSESKINSKTVNFNTKKGRFIKNVHDVLGKRYPDTFRLMYIFPFAQYPFPILLSDNLSSKIKSMPANENIFQESIPFKMDQLKQNFFKGCTAFLLLLHKDKVWGSSLEQQIRGVVHTNKRLLEKLGFRVIILEQNFCQYFVLPSHFIDVNSDNYKIAENVVLDSIQNSKLKYQK